MNIGIAYMHIAAVNGKRGNEFKTGRKVECVGDLEGRKDREAGGGEPWKHRLAIFPNFLSHMLRLHPFSCPTLPWQHLFPL